MIPHQITAREDGHKTLFALVPGADGPIVMDSQQPGFQEAVDLLSHNEISGDPDDYQRLIQLANPEVIAVEKFRPLSERVSVAAGRVFFDGDEIDNRLTQQIGQFIEADVEDWKPLVAFWEKLATNPNPHSREELYGWITSHQVTLTEDGDMIAYKGVRVTDREGVDYESITAGPAIVDGVLQPEDQCVPNNVGSLIEHPRERVLHAPDQACASGLHAADFPFARGFGDGTVLKIRVNPRDVVSVPRNEAKVRVCRYLILEKVDGPVEGLVEATVTGDTEPQDEDDYADLSDAYADKVEEERCEDCDEPACDGECQDEKDAFESEHEGSGVEAKPECFWCNRSEPDVDLHKDLDGDWVCDRCD